MPTLHWTGKNKVVNHHHDVPYRVLHHDYRFHANGDTTAPTGNKIIHGDNLEALKSLLPEYEGRIKCIYIDPPYNTGNEGWVYNDAVNDPKIKKWLGQVVGKEGEDLNRHDKWLCMMYPRLKLLLRLLAEDGVFLCSIDENEYHKLKLVLDEIFGPGGYLGSICWKTRNTDNRVKTKLSIDHEYVLVYSHGNGMFGRTIDRSDFKNADDDKRGPYVTDPLTGKATAEDRPNLHYEIQNPETGDVYLPDQARGWITDRNGFNVLLADKRIWWPPNPLTGKPRKKRYLSETEDRMPLSSFWADTKGQTGADEVDQILGERKFSFPKSVDFLCRLLDVAIGNDGLILDSFAGSGTTAHAVTKLNAQDGGNRKFILIEMMDYAEAITAERVRRVMQGYGEGSKAVAGLGGGFDFYTVGEPLLLEDGNLNEAVGLVELRRYIGHAEGVKPQDLLLPDNLRHPALVGEANGSACFFHYQADASTTLDMAFLATLSWKPEAAVIYADNCVLADDFLRRHRLRFKKIPRDIHRV